MLETEQSSVLRIGCWENDPEMDGQDAAHVQALRDLAADVLRDGE
jgi:hypothetical protein